MGFDAKALKKLADACRKAGITHYKCADFELTVSPDAPESNYKKRKAVKESAPIVDDNFKSEQLTDDALLMWSVLDPTEETAV